MVSRTNVFESIDALFEKFPRPPANNILLAHGCGDVMDDVFSYWHVLRNDKMEELRINDKAIFVRRPVWWQRDDIDYCTVDLFRMGDDGRALGAMRLSTFELIDEVHEIVSTIHRQISDYSQKSNNTPDINSDMPRLINDALRVIDHNTGTPSEQKDGAVMPDADPPELSDEYVRDLVSRVEYEQAVATCAAIDELLGLSSDTDRITTHQSNEEPKDVTKEAPTDRFDRIVRNMTEYLRCLTVHGHWAIEFHQRALPDLTINAVEDEILITGGGSSGDKWTIEFDTESCTAFIKLRGAPASFSIRYLLNSGLISDNTISSICNDLEWHFGFMLRPFNETINNIIMTELNDNT